MSALTEDLAGLVDAVVRPLIEVEEELDITAKEAEDGSVLVEIRVSEGDIGKVIGRKAIRTLARAAASREGKQVEVELAE